MYRRKIPISKNLFLTHVTGNKLHLVESTGAFVVKIKMDEHAIRFTSVMRENDRLMMNNIIVPRGSYRMLRAAYKIHVAMADEYKVDHSFY
jgi:hypothetical protein